ncbi:MAG: CoA transferase [Flammeovirgaceae bacterium]
MKQLQQIIHSLPKRFKKHRAQGYVGAFHFKLHGDCDSFTITIQDGNCTIATGLVGKASCTLELSCQDYIDLESGTLQVQEAFLSQKITTNNVLEAMNFGNFFQPYYKYNSIPKQVLESRKPQHGPLVGIRILDFSRLLPGPLATMMLADMGAEVIKIEHPDFPDYVRNYPPFIKGVSANYLALNRSKRSLSLDYQSESGKETFFQLIRTADLVVEQFRPGVMDEWGIGYEIAKTINPRISYVSLTGYGQTGHLAQKAGHDLNYMAYSGVLGLIKDQNGKPVIPGVQLADIAAGSYMTVSACTSALLARAQTGKGQHVDVAMLDGLLPLITLPFAQYQASGKVHHNDELPLSGALANYNVYECSDGKWLALGALEPKFWKNFCQFLGKPDWAALVSFDQASSKALQQEVSQVFKQKKQADWLLEAEKFDVCLSPIALLNELEGNLHLQARNMIITEHHEKVGDFKNIGIPIKFGGTPAKPAWSAPQIGDDTQAILKELDELRHDTNTLKT